LNQKYASQVGEEGQDYLMRMNRAAARMQRMLADLLSYSRVTTKAQPFNPVDLTRVAALVLQELDLRIEQSGAQVELQELCTIEADPSQMHQLFTNLVANALKFHKPGTPPHVLISCELIPTSDSEGKPAVELVVADNGIGFEPRYLERIFQPFQRLHGMHEYEGSGMGLAICRKIVERHGGTITARSVPGEGSAFVITLPVHQPSPQETPTEQFYY
jgi:signal transduction histidine kinase